MIARELWTLQQLHTNNKTATSNSISIHNNGLYGPTYWPASIPKLNVHCRSCAKVFMGKWECRIFLVHFPFRLLTVSRWQPLQCPLIIHFTLKPTRRKSTQFFTTLRNFFHLSFACLTLTFSFISACDRENEWPRFESSTSMSVIQCL